MAAAVITGCARIRLVVSSGSVIGIAFPYQEVIGVILGGEFVFHAAHNLTEYKGKCENLHGHSYRLRVEIEGPVRPDGMVMDFAEMKAVVNRMVISILDHAYINEVIEGNASLERLAEWVWVRLKDSLPLKRIKMWETDRNYLIYNGPETEETAEQEA